MLLNERHQIKRKYAQYGAKHINKGGAIRDKIILFVGEAGSVSYDELNQFLTKLEAERGKVINLFAWIRQNSNSSYFIVSAQNIWKLSKYGQRVYDYLKSDTEMTDPDDEISDKLTFAWWKDKFMLEDMATPANVNGMGDVSFPSNPDVPIDAQIPGSGDTPNKKKKKRVFKRFDDFIKKDI